MPIVCDTVAAGLACGNLNLGCCCPSVSDAAPAIMNPKRTNMETRLTEIISYLRTAKCGRIMRRGQAASNRSGVLCPVNLQLFTNADHLFAVSCFPLLAR